MWEQITVIPRWKQLCHRLRKQKGIVEEFLKASTALVESLSIQSLEAYLTLGYVLIMLVR